MSPVSRLLLKGGRRRAAGLVHRVTPASAGWRYVGFELHRLEPGQSLERDTGAEEVCLVLVAGHADVSASGERWPGLGGRGSPFEPLGPHAVYVPRGGHYRVVARSDLELAVCSAPGGGEHRARWIDPRGMRCTSRGQGSSLRQVRDILPEGEPAHALLVVEVLTPGGHWSSYPPHKHDVDNLPDEAQLEEIYYHRISGVHGFALQRVYTQDRSLDVALVVEDGDAVLVPCGYHPCAAADGYDLYYLNVMAGPRRCWRYATDPAHRWLLQR